MNQTRVLFLSTDNAARSQMAEAFLNHLGEGRFEVHSAGLDPREVSPLAAQVMKERGVDISAQSTRGVIDYLGKMHFTYIITVCASADENCPVAFLTMGQREHWAFDDPAKFQGPDEEKLQKYRDVRDQVEFRIREFIAANEP
ncbi:MAG: arsenate reductase ArsC [Anaerolineae bacterium]|nr:MAG: arsenate reductase ArsC [Anaerolineae bacterium]